MKPLAIFFAAVPASGKTRMAHLLSEEFGLPIFSSDSIRYDTKVSKNVVDINEAIDAFNEARESRSKAMFGRKRSFIYDSSVDRRWKDVKKQAEEAGYQWLLIDFDLSKDMVEKHRKMFDRTENDELFEKWFADHQKFHEQFDIDAHVHITDENYAKRYDLARAAVAKALNIS